LLLSEIYDFLDLLSPFALQENWDNSGLQIGSKKDTVKQIYLSLDIDFALLDTIESDSLLVTHHPLIFKGLKSLDKETYPANLIYKMVEKNISLISMHTNFDKTHLNRYLCEEILGFALEEQSDFIASFNLEMSFEEVLNRVASRLEIKNLSFLKNSDYIKKGSLVCGAGGSLLESCKSDLFLSGDLKYHDYIKAKSEGISLIDITHYHSEKHFAHLLHQHLKNLPIKAIIANFESPVENRH